MQSATPGEIIWKRDGSGINSNILTLRGSSEEMGFSHGSALKQHIQKEIETFLSNGSKTFGVPYRELLDAAEICEPFIPVEYIKEMLALAYAADIPYKTILAANCLVDIDLCFSSTRAHCCNFVVMAPASKEGLLLHGRNLDFPHDKILPRIATTIVRVPNDGRIPTVAASWAGFIGILTGMNREKVSCAEVGCPSPKCELTGVPISFIIRSGLESCRSDKGFYSFFEAVPRTAGFNLAVCDGFRKTAICIESTRTACGRRTAFEGRLVVDDVCFCKETRRNRVCHPSAAFRYARMIQLIGENFGLIDEDTALNLLKDNHDLAWGRKGRGYNCISNRHTIQSVLFIPEQSRILVAQGTIPATSGAYSSFGEGDFGW